MIKYLIEKINIKITLVKGKVYAEILILHRLLKFIRFYQLADIPKLNIAGMELYP